VSPSLGSLTKEQVKIGFTNWLISEGSRDTILSIVERKGDDAGNIGYFYVQLTSSEAFVVPANATEFQIKKVPRNENYLYFYTKTGLMPSKLPRYDGNLFFILDTFVNYLFGYPSASQRWLLEYTTKIHEHL
jgi:hypothetical protein